MSEFLRAIRGFLNAHRRGIVDLAFARFDVSGTGEVTIADLQQAYDPSHHPGFQAGEATADEVFLEFMGSLGDKDHDGVITKQEWYDYYAGIGSNFDSDAEFELSVRNAWH